MSKNIKSPKIYNLNVLKKLSLQKMSLKKTLLNKKLQNKPRITHKRIDDEIKKIDNSIQELKKLKFQAENNQVSKAVNSVISNSKNALRTYKNYINSINKSYKSPTFHKTLSTLKNKPHTSRKLPPKSSSWVIV